MCKRKNKNLGIFVDTNKGEIIDCHGKLSWEKENGEYVFCVNNSGVILNFVEDSESNQNCEEIVDDVEKNSIDYAKDSSEQHHAIIEIHSTEQLTEICHQVNLGDSFYSRANYKLLKDLDLLGTKWTPFGQDEHYPFSGTFDGNGHSIKNVVISGNHNGYVGFFGYLKHAVIQNLSIEGMMKGGKCTSSIASVSEESLIQTCFSSAKVIGNHSVGGFIAENRGRIAHCYFSGNVQYRRFIFS